MEQIIKLNRDSLRMVASGAYLQINKNYDQQTHQSFVEGALFLWDFVQAGERNNKVRGDANGQDGIKTASDRVDKVQHSGLSED